MAAVPVPDYAATWTAAGVVVAFTVTAFTFRIQREAGIRSRTSPGEEITYWLPPADLVLIASMVVSLVGVFVLPILGAGLGFARYALGWSLLLLAAYPAALAGHYDILLGRVPGSASQRYARDRGYPWLARQEAYVIGVLTLASLAYFAAIAVKEASN